MSHSSSLGRPIRVEPLHFPSDAVLRVPGSKSEANRLLVAAALSGKTVTITGASASDDVCHLVNGLATLGYAARFADSSNGTVVVGPRQDASQAAAGGTLFCGNAGTALRFLISVAAITPGEWVITGDEHMQRRPIQPLVDAWRALGLDIEATNGCPPVRLRGAAGTPQTLADHVQLDASVSSQFLSSLMLVAARMPAGLRIDFDGPLASRGYAALTLRMLARFGVTGELGANFARVAPGYGDAPPRAVVGGDWSGMGAWTCLNHSTKSKVTAPNLATASGQSDEQLATALRAFDSLERTIDVEPIPDQFLNLAAFAATVPGTTRLVGAANVRVKECDRVAVMARELRKCGIVLQEHDDGLTVHGSAAIRTATIDPEADHRVAMAFALLGLLRGHITVHQPECVAKSYPAFWQDVQAVRRQHRAVTLVGMRAAGKTTLADALAARTGSAWVDTDAQFVAMHGPIAEFVQKHGWPAFRTHEEQLVAAALQPGTIVATGGGAIESAATRKLLHETSHCVFLHAPLDILQQRLAADASAHRPSLTGRSALEELPDVWRRRLPLYQDTAHRTVLLDAATSTADAVDALLHRTP
ncbi:MAG: shikimate kinase [Planctomycetota bacterium]